MNKNKPENIASKSTNQSTGPPQEAGLLPVFTLVVWMGCLVGGLIGFWFSNHDSVTPAKPPAIAAPEILNVDVIQDASPPDAVPPQPVKTPADLPPVPAAPALPAPSPAIAFAQPTNMPASPPVQMAAIRPTNVQQLTFGEGEGRQPAPDYPREAVVAQQEGVVVVLFTVDEDGRVTSAQASGPCPWPILNQAAVRAVRETWRFARGPVRTYEVSIEFQLHRQ
jgi:periplasmic protein TonB